MREHVPVDSQPSGSASRIQRRNHAAQMPFSPLTLPAENPASAGKPACYALRVFFPTSMRWPLNHKTVFPASQPATPKRGAQRRRTRGSRELRLDDRVVIEHGMPTPLWQDLYHRALVVRWPMFFVSLAMLFLLLNTAFATLYMLGDGSIANQFPKGFGGAFFFSVETLATVGYGDMHPQTIYAHWIATLEIFVGMSGIALATGLIFARFSRPHAKIVFARYAVVRPLRRPHDADGAFRQRAPKRNCRGAAPSCGSCARKPLSKAIRCASSTT